MRRPSTSSSSELKILSDTQRLVIQNTSVTFGKSAATRKNNSSMHEILSWDETDPDAPWNSKKKIDPDVELSNQWAAKIKRSKSNWVTETMDQFRYFNVSSENKEHVYIDATEDPEIRLQKPLPGSKLEKERLLEEQKRQPKRKGKKIVQESDQLKTPAKETYKEGETGSALMKHMRAASAPSIRKEQEVTSSKNTPEKKEVAARYLDYSKKQKKEVVVDDPEYLEAHEKRIKQRIKAFKEQSRWLPNSAFQTYFGRPPFENYGRANVTPIHGGPVYGQYMKTHNINPHRGGNSPKYKQVYDRAELQSAMFPPSNKVELPRKRPEDLRLTDAQIKELNSRNVLMPEEFTKDLKKKLPKPDLTKAILFASEENTPVATPKEKKTAKNILANLIKLDQEIKRQKFDSLKHSMNQEELIPQESFSQPPDLKIKSAVKSAFNKSSIIEERSTDHTMKRSTVGTRNLQSQETSSVSRKLDFGLESSIKPRRSSKI